MSYKEEIFERAEKKFKDRESMLDWLDGFKDKPTQNDYEKDGGETADDTREIYKIKDKIEESKESKEIEGYGGRIDEIDLDVQLKKDVKKDYIEKISRLVDEETDKYFGDIKRLKEIKVDVDEVNKWLQNVKFNAARRSIRSAYVNEDIGKLQSLRSDVKGIKYESELIDEINELEERLKRAK